MTFASSEKLLPEEPALRPGDVVDGKYSVGECIGSGGMGLVFAATHIDLNRRVALKCVRSEFAKEPEMVARFLNEARAVASLTNEHVAHVLDFGRLDSGVPFLVMERLDGHNLATELEAHGPMPVSRAADYVLQACEALAEAHAHGVVHRDIKPENLFLASCPDHGKCIKVLDFGVSKQPPAAAWGSLTLSGSSMGSPAYMSPEQMKDPHEVDLRSDIWSLGVVLHQLLAGTLPFAGETLPELCAHVLCAPPPRLGAIRPDVPAQLEAIVLRCLDKDPARRFADVAELGRALAEFASPTGWSSVSTLERLVSTSEPEPHTPVIGAGPAAPCASGFETTLPAVERPESNTLMSARSASAPASSESMVLAVIALPAAELADAQLCRERVLQALGRGSQRLSMRKGRRQRARRAASGRQVSASTTN